MSNICLSWIGENISGPGKYLALNRAIANGLTIDHKRAVFGIERLQSKRLHLDCLNIGILEHCALATLRDKLEHLELSDALAHKDHYQMVVIDLFIGRD